jgi:hypothetical protein
MKIVEEYKKVLWTVRCKLCGTLWNYGGSSDEIFSHGRRYLVGIASPASRSRNMFFRARIPSSLTMAVVSYPRAFPPLAG